MNINEERFNPETYMVIDRITGEEIKVDIFIDKVKKAGWEKVWAKTIAEYMKLSGGGVQKVLSYLIAEKDSRNLIHGTHRGIAEELAVAPATVSKVLAKAQKEHFIKKVSNGVWFLDPRMIRYGSNGHGVMLLKLWDEL